MQRSRRRLLGRFTYSAQLQEEVARSSLLDLSFEKGGGDATLLSLDGNRSVVWIAPSGAIAGLLVQDYAGEDERHIPFEFGTIDIVNDGMEISVFLRSLES
jgi:hypothetical protein